MNDKLSFSTPAVMIGPTQVLVLGKPKKHDIHLGAVRWGDVFTFCTCHKFSNEPKFSVLSENRRKKRCQGKVFSTVVYYFPKVSKKKNSMNWVVLTTSVVYCLTVLEAAILESSHFQVVVPFDGTREGSVLNFWKSQEFLAYKWPSFPCISYLIFTLYLSISESKSPPPFFNKNVNLIWSGIT